MKNQMLFNCCVLTLLLLTQVVASPDILHKNITHYKSIKQSVIYENKKYRLIRSFIQNNQKQFLAVNEITLKTQLLKEGSFKEQKGIEYESKYYRLLQKYSKPPYKLQNYGLTHLSNKNIYITTDLCPSSKSGYEKQFYQDLSTHYKTPVPVTIFISGRWIKHHQKSFLSLIQLHESKKLDITWANHTHDHYYDAHAPLEKNFLLLPNTEVKKEIFRLEKLLLSYGITPSVLFRFPGLVSDKKSILLINELGLIPIGSNAWLAKNEKVKEGSIVLLHGNKNEPYGIKKARELLFEKPNYALESILDGLK